MSKVVENFGKYVLLEKLAAGGMAEVFLAKSTGAAGISRFVAIKRILPQYSDNPEFIDMFKDEAKIAVNLNHNNIVSIFDFGVQEHQFFLVMEYVEGQNLRQVLNHLKKENKYFSIDQIVNIIKEVAGGLDHAHRCLDGSTGRPLNITHRDMSPQNIMVSFEGELKIVDFGIAKAETQMEHTRAGTIKGKFGYMSPEQAEGLPVDFRTDIFSLGIIMWELLAQERLFTAQSEAATLRKIRDCQIPSLRKLNPNIPVELEKICNKALSRDKNLRYQSASALHKDLNRFLNVQYPEFSPHDFAVFMKSAFSVMFLENRRKLAEFAKIQGVQDERTMVTETDHSANTSHSSVDLELPAEKLSAELDVNINAKGDLNLSQLKTDQAAVKKPTVAPTFNPHTSFSKSSSSIGLKRPPPKVEKKSSPWISMSLMLMLAGGGLWYWMQSQKLTLPQMISKGIPSQEAPPTEVPAQAIAATPTPPVETSTVPAPPATSGQIESASKRLYATLIESTPPGARVFIDGQDTGMITPLRRNLEGGRNIKVSMRREGYLPFEQVLNLEKEGEMVRAVLKPVPQMGYISLEIPNAGVDPIVTINGRRITEKLPISILAVPAGIPIKIEASNPFLGLQGQAVLTVGASQKRPVRMILSQPMKPREATGP